ncbi:ankyrin repeat domain-containing protein [Undibacterium oligocarboniphilum]|uniref:Ankyrin repeat domain-containing protein n=1 Tax=Undibacterium oligocarboniphilum TaxID=666702 RepID=A0A850QPR4_9BURK|nr:ankyrin repeat domain-containing protein [Undibacterium oligocarboniphilum]MBC3870383.1 ankyrin repeat domain-containing protein [Undibacterium oligocarboniphilum]NVO78374.1 ankyrin repeat domain-containing protein [Undibacterium oligocarboniphilum]
MLSRIACVLVTFCLLLACPTDSYADSYADFLFAIRFNDAETVKNFLQQGIDVNSVEGERGETILMIALREKAMRVVDVLLHSPDIRVAARAKNGDTALMIASFLGNATAVSQLIDAGAEVNQPGWTALHYAAASGNAEVVAILLEHYAYIDAESPNKTTPLMMAARYGRAAAFQLLLDEGADPDLKNDKGMTALDFAIELERRDLIDILNARKTRSSSN